jgi:hypothetical protein
LAESQRDTKKKSMAVKDQRTRTDRIWSFCFWFAETLFVAPIVAGVTLDRVMEKNFFAEHRWVAQVLGPVVLTGFGLLCLMSALSYFAGRQKYGGIGVFTIIVGIVLAILFPHF